ncbi:kinase-like domain-containing protein, partial [Suillus discolor]
MSTQSQPEARLVAVKSFRIFVETDMQTLQKINKSIRREAYVWVPLSHDNILPLEGVIVDDEFGPFPAFVSPWMENQTLNDYLKWKVGLSRAKKLTMAKEIAAGLQYLHDKGIVHGDLTDANVLVSSDGRLCLGDFGLSMILAEARNTTFNSCHAGNMRWMAPELVLVEEEDAMSKPTKAGDVYSYGCIMMRVFSGHKPYHHIKRDAAIITAMYDNQKPFSRLVDISEEIQHLAQRCWSSNMEYRPLVGKIAESLRLQTAIAETVKMMVLQLPVTVTQISQADLTKCDDGLDVLGAPLRYKWVVHGSSETEVAVKTLRDDVDSQNDINKIYHRIHREIYVREKLRHETILALYGMTEGSGIFPSFVYPW